MSLFCVRLPWRERTNWGGGSPGIGAKGGRGKPGTPGYQGRAGLQGPSGLKGDSGNPGGPGPKGKECDVTFKQIANCGLQHFD